MTVKGVGLAIALQDNIPLKLAPPRPAELGDMRFCPACALEESDDVSTVEPVISRPISSAKGVALPGDSAGPLLGIFVAA